VASAELLPGRHPEGGGVILMQKPVWNRELLDELSASDARCIDL
jgi:hypothetical protein